MTECMELVFTHVTKCRVVQKNHFGSNMANSSVIVIFREQGISIEEQEDGNKVY